LAVREPLYRAPVCRVHIRIALRRRGKTSPSYRIRDMVG
jgi:hypothetical protein